MQLTRVASYFPLLVGGSFSVAKGKVACPEGQIPALSTGPAAPHICVPPAARGGSSPGVIGEKRMWSQALPSPCAQGAGLSERRVACAVRS